MPRYIDATKLKAEFDKCLWGKEWDKALATVCANNTPTADVVEVVRCKDCRYNDNGNCDAICEVLEGDLIGVTLRCSDDFFCTYGKRREDGEQ